MTKAEKLIISAYTDQIKDTVKDDFLKLCEEGDYE